MHMTRLFIALILAAFALGSQAQSDFRSMTGDVKLLIGNDFGRNGYYDQKPIARTMAEAAEILGPEAVLALGDVHHFEGVQSTADPLWMTNYELIYDHPELMIDWFAVCGNHEYRGNTGAVLDYSGLSRRWAMPARYYARSFEENGTTLKVVFIDTTPLIDKYHKKSDSYPDAALQDTAAQLEWLDRTLADATEDWVVVAGHHPIYADTDKSDSERTDMQRKVDSILRRHKVEMYVCGHIHNFQHIRRPDSRIDYVVNTSASQSREVRKTDGTVFCSDATGFSVLTADKSSLKLHMVDKDGKIIHTVVLKR